MNDMENDTSGMGCLFAFLIVGGILIVTTYIKLGVDGLKMIAVFAPIFPFIYFFSDRWGRVDHDEL